MFEENGFSSLLFLPLDRVTRQLIFLSPKKLFFVPVHIPGNMLQILSDNLEALLEENGFSFLSSLGQNYKAFDFSVSKEAFLLCLSTFLGKGMYWQTRVLVRSPWLQMGRWIPN